MKRIVVIGGGISGFVFAINSKKNDNDIIILEGQDKPLKKLLLTGNGKCNYFNEDFISSKYHSCNDELLSQIISLENKKKILAFFDKIGVIPRKKENYYYPFSNQAISIKNTFMREIEDKNIKLELNSYVKDVKKVKNKFKVYYNDKVIECDKVVLSTGGKSYSNTGSDGFGYVLCERLGHSIVEPLPALVGLRSNNVFVKDLKGVRSNVKVSLFINDKFIKNEIGELQFTDYGLSGICIFNLSSIANRFLFENNKVMISINFLDRLHINTYEDFKEFLFSSKYNFKNKKIVCFLDNLLNYKITNVILKKAKINSDVIVSELFEDQIYTLFTFLTSFSFDVVDANSFDVSQVTSGGVSISEINTLTFESKIVPNLYIIGELLDIDGDCGGYNISFAVLSAILAGESA